MAIHATSGAAPTLPHASYPTAGELPPGLRDSTVVDARDRFSASVQHETGRLPRSIMGEGEQLQSAFRTHLESIGRAQSTIDDYVRVIERADRWLRAHTGHPIEAAHPVDVRAWAETTPYTWSTRKQARTALRQWQDLVGHPHDLAAAIRVPRKPRGECRAPEDHETARVELAAHAAGHRGLAVLLGLYLGMRCSEIAAATWSGYDGRTWTFTRAKGGKVVTKPVHPRLAEAADRTPRYGPYVFPGGMRSSRPHVHPGTVWQWCVDISEGAGVRITTHQLRHASIARVVEELGLLAGQEWADHDDPKTTRIYSRARRGLMQEAAASLSWADDGVAA